MKIAIIGAGFTGLAAAYYLSLDGHRVSVFEKDEKPGGLAIGYQEKEWEWSLEHHYHHWFTNDNSILDLAREIHHNVLIPRPKTSVYVKNTMYQMDSPLKLLQFPLLSVMDRFRMAATLGMLRYNPFWKPLEKVHATSFLPAAMGKKSYQMIWEPQLKNKFGTYVDEMSLAWFWARIKKRTSNLAYPEGGFLTFALHLKDVIKKLGGSIYFSHELLEIKSEQVTTIKIKSNDSIQEQEFDKIIVTLPSAFFLKTAPQLPESYKNSIIKRKSLGATNLVLRLNQQFLIDNTYWLSICDTNSPIMAIVEHTNFMDKKHYNNEHIVYLGNYVSIDHPYFSMDEKSMFKTFEPFLQKIHPGFEKSLISMRLFKAPFAQPIIPTNYSKRIPHFETPLKNVYLSNIEQVYPWDRGTNYAVELGKKAAAVLSHS